MTIERKWQFLAAAILILIIGGLSGRTHASSADRFVFLPGRVWLKGGERLSKAIGLEPSSPYLFDKGSVRRLSVPADIYPVSTSLGTRGLVALSGTRHPGTTEGNLGVPIVRVLKIDGAEVIQFDSAMDPAWSSDGAKLAFRFGRRVQDGPAQTDSIGLWDYDTGIVQRFRSQPIGVGWLGPNLLLDYGSQVTVQLPSGEESSTPYKGPAVSRDLKFAVSNRPEAGVQVWNNSTGQEITSEILNVLGGSSLVSHAPPFWAGDSEHTLCVPTCIYPKPGRSTSQSDQCEVVYVDAEALQVVRRVRGEVVAVSPDLSSALTRVGNQFRTIELAK